MYEIHKVLILEKLIIIAVNYGYIIYLYIIYMIFKVTLSCKRLLKHFFKEYDYRISVDHFNLSYLSHDSGSIPCCYMGSVEDKIVIPKAIISCVRYKVT